MASLECRERIKALPSVTVHALEHALDTAFKQCGHRNLKVLTASLDGITWKTAASKHVKAFLVLWALLFQIFLVCKNGLVPAANLEKAGAVEQSCLDNFAVNLFQLGFFCFIPLIFWKAFKAVHSSTPFEKIDGMTGIETGITFLSLKIRQLAAKLRTLKEDWSLWETFQKKLNLEEYEKIMALLKIIQIESKATLPIAVEEKKEPLTKAEPRNFENQLVLWSPPTKPSASTNVRLDFEEAGI